MSHRIVCFGAAHWDVVARANPGTVGADRPGSVVTRPGGVGFNLAAGLASLDIEVTLVAPVGGDVEGARLLDDIRSRGIDTAGMVIRAGRPTGQYVAIEDADGELLHAVADAGIMETMTPERMDFEGLGNAAVWFVEANLMARTIAAIAERSDRPPLAANPVSEAKAGRLVPVLAALDILYCNKREAEVLCGTAVADAAEASTKLHALGVARAIVTDGPRDAADMGPAGVTRRTPPSLTNPSVTGVGDAFMAGHLAAVLDGATPDRALEAAFEAVSKRTLAP